MSVSAFIEFASIIVSQSPSAASVPILMLPLEVPEEFMDVTDLKIFEVVTTPLFDPEIVSVNTWLSKPKPAITKLVPVVSCSLLILILAPR